MSLTLRISSDYRNRHWPRFPWVPEGQTILQVWDTFSRKGTNKEISKKHIKNSDKITNLLVVLDKAFVENNFEEMWKCLSKLRFYLKHGKELSKAVGNI